MTSECWNALFHRNKTTESTTAGEQGQLACGQLRRVRVV